MVYGPPAGFVRNKPSVYIDRDYCTGCMKCAFARKSTYSNPPATSTALTRTSQTTCFAPDADCACTTAPPMLSESS